MATAKFMLVLSAVSVLASGSAAAQALEKRHQIELRVGLWNQVTGTKTEIGLGGVSTTVGGSGFMGGLAYGHWLREHLALKISVGAMAVTIDTEVGTSGVSTRTGSVAPLLVSLKYYFPKSTYGSSVRPFAGAGLGAYIGSQTETGVGLTTTVEARTEAAFGGEPSVGVDFVLGRHTMASVALAYALMTDFNQSIGGSKNYSGLQLTFGFSLVLGRVAGES
jgi:outer membrane protein W